MDIYFLYAGQMLCIIRAAKENFAISYPEKFLGIHYEKQNRI